MYKYGILTLIFICELLLLLREGFFSNKSVLLPIVLFKLLFLLISPVMNIPMMLCMKDESVNGQDTT